jgi:hypothetical protein
MANGLAPPELAVALGELYDDAHDPNRWGAATIHLASLFGRAGVLFAQGEPKSSVGGVHHAGFDQSFMVGHWSQW